MQLTDEVAVENTPKKPRFLRFPKPKEISYLMDSLVSAWIQPRDTVMVCGFWRSGTTWLMEAVAEFLKAKTVFEPDNPRLGLLQQFCPQAQLSGPSKKYFMPFCGADTLHGRPLYEFFDRTLRSKVRGQVVRLSRPGLAASLNRRVVAKYMLAQLCLRPLQNTFSMPVLYIYRDPRAIVASMKMKGNWEKMYGAIGLREQLLDPPDGRAEFFKQWQEQILKYDGKNLAARVAAYWALTEKFVQHAYADGPARIAFVKYEELCRAGEEKLVSLLKQLRLENIAAANSHGLQADSAMTTQKRLGASVVDRVAGWKKVLTPSEAGGIESVAQRFGFEDRLVDE